MRRKELAERARRSSSRLVLLHSTVVEIEQFTVECRRMEDTIRIVNNRDNRRNGNLAVVLHGHRGWKFRRRNIFDRDIREEIRISSIGEARHLHDAFVGLRRWDIEQTDETFAAGGYFPDSNKAWTVMGDCQSNPMQWRSSRTREVFSSSYLESFELITGCFFSWINRWKNSPKEYVFLWSTQSFSNKDETVIFSVSWPACTKKHPRLKALNAKDKTRVGIDHRDLLTGPSQRLATIISKDVRDALLIVILHESQFDEILRIDRSLKSKQFHVGFQRNSAGDRCTPRTIDIVIIANIKRFVERRVGVD